MLLGGGESAMKIVVFGGSGFIGQELCAELARRQHSLVLLVRDLERAQGNLTSLPQTEVRSYDPTDPSSIAQTLVGADSVINLVGILNESRGSLFEQVHSEFVRILTELSAENKVSHFIQISSIGASVNAASAYLRSKGKGEGFVLRNDSVSHTIVRLSVVFGERDKFINKFATLLRLPMPLMPLPGANAQMQPIALQDVIALLARVVEDKSYKGKILHAGGPQVLTMQQIVETVATAMGRRPVIVPLGYAVSYAMGSVCELVPFVDLLTRDNCLSMQHPSVCSPNPNDALQDQPLIELAAGVERMFATKEGEL